jgi:uncharacterized protein with LGFP repeats
VEGVESGKVSPQNSEVLRPSIETLKVQIKALDEKFTLWFAETNKRNDQRFQAQQEAVQAALISAEKAVTKAEMASERRFEAVNEFRQSLSDQTMTYMPRTEYTVQHQALSDKLSLSSERIAALEKKIIEIASRGTGRNDVWVIMVAVLGLLLSLGTLLAVFIHTK